MDSPVITRCKCGHDKMHPRIRPIKKYSLWGAMLLIMGYTARPIQIDFVCGECGTVFDSITNRAMLERFRYDEPGLNDR
jgi:hypothetical protein